MDATSQLQGRVTGCAMFTPKEGERKAHLKVKLNELFTSFQLTKHISKAKGFESLRKFKKVQNDARNHIKS